MELTEQNLRRIKDIARMHAKFQLAIRKGSKKLFQQFSDYLHMQGRGFAMNELVPEKPEGMFLAISQISVIKSRSGSVFLELALAVARNPENCGAKLRMIDSGNGSGEGPSSLEITCALTEVGSEAWTVEVTRLNGVDRLPSLVETRTRTELTESQALDLLKNLAEKLDPCF